MPGDRPTDAPTNSTLGATGAAPPPRESGGTSPSPSDQTPELDAKRRMKDMALRPYGWVRERPAMALSLIGGLAVIGVGTWLALRTRRRTRWELVRDRVRDHSTDLYEWLKSKF